MCRLIQWWLPPRPTARSNRPDLGRSGRCGAWKRQACLEVAHASLSQVRLIRTLLHLTEMTHSLSSKGLIGPGVAVPSQDLDVCLCCQVCGSCCRGWLIFKDRMLLVSSKNLCYTRHLFEGHQVLQQHVALEAKSVDQFRE